MKSAISILAICLVCGMIVRIGMTHAGIPFDESYRITELTFKLGMLSSVVFFFLSIVTDDDVTQE